MPRQPVRRSRREPLTPLLSPFPDIRSGFIAHEADMPICMQADVAVGFYESLAGGGRMDTFFARLIVFVALAIAALTAGCVIDKSGVVPASGAVDVPGVQGAWKRVGANSKEYILVTRTSLARYSIDYSDGKGELTYEGAFFVPVPGVQDAYAFSTPTEDKRSSARFVLLVRVRDQMIDFWIPDGKVLEELATALDEAKRSGVSFNKELPPNSAETLFKLYSRAAKHKTFSGFAFSRGGWFTTQSTESMTVEGADMALARNDIGNGVKMLDSLSNRGHAGAQYRLAGMYAVGKGVARDPATAIFLYKSAYRGRHPQAAGALAHFLTTSGLSGKPGYDDAINWYAVQALIDGKRDASMAALKGATFRDCSKRTEVAAGDTAEACAERMAEFHMMRVDATLMREETINALVEAEIEIAERKKASAEYGKQIKELKREKKELLDQQRR